MQSTLTIVRYPKRFSFFGFLSMAVFHLFLRRNKNISFYKLMGSGKNGTFDVRPDLRQWALLCVFKNEVEKKASPPELFGKYIAGWWRRFCCEVFTVALQPLAGHGKWDGAEAFGKLAKNTNYDGVIAVLTRASIRPSKARAFWKNVGSAAEAVTTAPGFIVSFGIGEIPWIKQATFSVWENKDLMLDYAYKKKQHQQVIQKTRKENWYSEELFVRFAVLWTSGQLRGKNEIARYLD